MAFLQAGDGAWGAFLERRGLGHVRFTPPRASPVAYADAAGALHPGLIAAHCVQAGADDLRLLARRGVHVAVCPRSNLNLGVGLPPLPEMLEAGINVCAGTDSLASVDTLNVLDDVAELHRAFPYVPPARLVEIATRNGAGALGLADVGAIAPGMAAALAYAPSPAARGRSRGVRGVRPGAAAARGGMSDVLGRAVLYGRMIKIAHSVFALPFALASAALAAREASAGRSCSGSWWRWWARGARPWGSTGWPTTTSTPAIRDGVAELPAGVLGRGEVWALVLLSAAALVLAAAMLNPLCLARSPVALAVVLGYSYTKRFTALSHLVLGLALAIAPVGAWLAIRGRVPRSPVVLGLAVLFWVAGFDIVYACQDAAFDRASGLHSVPARLGIRGALAAARAFHVLAVILLAAVYPLAGVHPSTSAAWPPSRRCSPGSTGWSGPTTSRGWTRPSSP